MDKPPYLTHCGQLRLHRRPMTRNLCRSLIFSGMSGLRLFRLTSDECATAIHLAHGDIPEAASLLKVPPVRLHRLLRGSPRLQRVLEESFALTLYRAVSVPIRTLHDPNADNRRLEWASTQVLKSRLAQGHPFSPAPASSLLSSNAPAGGKVIISWLDEP